MALGIALLAAAGAVWSKASAAPCPGPCIPVGLATFNPFAPAGPGDVTIMRGPNDRPVRFNPCEPIHYVVNPAGAPAGWDADLSAALAVVSGASGLRFTDDGVTTERPARDRPAYQPLRYGDRWVPVLIAWSDPAETDLLPPGAAGDGGPTWALGSHGHLAAVTGTVVVERAIANRLPNGIGERLTHGRLLAHELSHVVGLGHSRDPSSLMAPAVGWNEAVLTAGDQAALARAGSGLCGPALIPRAG